MIRDIRVVIEEHVQVCVCSHNVMPLYATGKLEFFGTASKCSCNITSDARGLVIKYDDGTYTPVASASRPNVSAHGYCIIALSGDVAGGGDDDAPPHSGTTTDYGCVCVCVDLWMRADQGGKGGDDRTRQSDSAGEDVADRADVDRPRSRR